MADPKEKRQPGRHNLLEDLLATGLQPSREAPAESGVEFFIGEQVTEKGLCLLFKLDWGGSAPLFPDSEVKPDYLVLFVPKGGSEWIVTLVEMKGTSKKNLRHGLDQLTNGYQRLKTEAAAHLPPQTRIRWQGILLHAQGADVPREKIITHNDKFSKDFPVRDVLHDHKVDLCDMVVSRLRPDRVLPTVQGRNVPAADGTIEATLTRGARSKKGQPTAAGLTMTAQHGRNTVDLALRRDVAGGVTVSEALQAELVEYCPPQASLPVTRGPGRPERAAKRRSA